MVVNFLGDSITYGVGADTPENNFVSVASRATGIKANNYGLGGTRIARRQVPYKPQHDRDFLMRAPFMDKNADFVFVFGGTNDYGHGDAKIGMPDDKTPYSFFGALNLLCEMLISDYGKEKICFILPLHREDEDNVYGDCGRKPLPGGTLSEYREAMLKVICKFGIEYIDLNDKFTIDRLAELTVDGLHPNNKGHDIIGSAVADFLKKKLIFQ